MLLVLSKANLKHLKRLTCLPLDLTIRFLKDGRIIHLLTPPLLEKTDFSDSIAACKSERRDWKLVPLIDGVMILFLSRTYGDAWNP